MPHQPLPHGHVLIGLTGQAGAGKDTVAAHLCKQHNFVSHAFAEPIRDMLTAMLVPAGIDYAHLFERSLKEHPIPGLGVSGRRLMQTLGTEWGRMVDPSLWVKLAALQLGLHDLPSSTPVHDRIVLTDVRFPNEAAWIHAMGGVVVGVQRDTTPVAQHESEQHIQHLQPKYTLDNTGSILALYDQVDALAEVLIA